MGAIDAKLDKIIILGCQPVELPDGSVGSHLLIDAKGLAALPKALVAWTSLQPLAELPKLWAGEDGGPRMVWAGHEPTEKGDPEAQLVHVCLQGVRIHRATINYPVETARGSSILVEADDLRGDAATLCEWSATKATPLDIKKWPEGAVFTTHHTARTVSKETEVQPKEDPRP